MEELEYLLDDFAKHHQINSKGPLCVVLVVTRKASKSSFPLQEEKFLTSNGGQVKGLGKGAVQKILNDYGIVRTLAEEGGRTSRGSINKMSHYVKLLNQLFENGTVEWDEIEKFWIERVKQFFASTPFRIKLDASISLRTTIRELLDDSFKRQKESPGTMYAGAMMQHLIGAKLRIALPKENIEAHGFSVADQPSGRKGDFLIGNASIHVTAAPTESLLRKCENNLNQGFKPIIITTTKGIGGAEALAENFGIADRIDIFEIEQFVATNVFELGGFISAELNLTIKELVAEYNKIVCACETDPSLRIDFS